MNVHIITGPNGMCRCGEDGKTCSEILADIVPKDLESYLAGYSAALKNQGAVDNNTQQLKAEIKKAYAEGYSKGHWDKENNGDYCPEQSADDWLSEL